MTQRRKRPAALNQEQILEELDDTDDMLSCAGDNSQLRAAAIGEFGGQGALSDSSTDSGGEKRKAAAELTPPKPKKPRVSSGRKTSQVSGKA